MKNYLMAFYFINFIFFPQLSLASEGAAQLIQNFNKKNQCVSQLSQPMNTCDFLGKLSNQLTSSLFSLESASVFKNNADACFKNDESNALSEIDLETAYSSKYHHIPLGFVSKCFGGFTERSRKKKIGLYYASLDKLDQIGNMLLNDTAHLEQILKEKNLDIDCEKTSSDPRTRAHCEALKKCNSNSSSRPTLSQMYNRYKSDPELLVPYQLQVGIDKLEDFIDKTTETEAQTEAEKEDKAEALTEAKNILKQKKDQLSQEVQKLNIEELSIKYPWFSVDDLNPTLGKIKDSLSQKKEANLKLLKKVENYKLCMTTGHSSSVFSPCDSEEIMETLSLFENETAPKKEPSNSFEHHEKAMSCAFNEKKQQLQKRNENSIYVTLGLAGATLIGRGKGTGKLATKLGALLNLTQGASSTILTLSTLNSCSQFIFGQKAASMKNSGSQSSQVICPNQYAEIQSKVFETNPNGESALSCAITGALSLPALRNLSKVQK